MLEHYARIFLFADDFPNRFAECAAFRGPLVVLRGFVPMRHHAPVQIFFPVDASLGAELHAEIYFAIVADDAHRNSALSLDDLNRHASEAARRAPNQDDVAATDDVWRPSHQHAIGGRTHQRRSCRFFPRQVRGLGHALMRLHAGKLREAAPVGFVAPDFERRIVHRIVAVADCGRVTVPDAAMNHDAVADFDVVHVVSGGVHDARRVAAADMKIRVIVLGLLARADHVDWRSERRPDVVEIHARRHHVDEHFAGADFRHRGFLDLELMLGFAEPVRADHLRIHMFGHVPDRRPLPDFVDFLLTHFDCLMVTTAATLRDTGRLRLAPVLFEVAALRAGISYLFAADLTILTCRPLGNEEYLLRNLRPISQKDQRFSGSTTSVGFLSSRRPRKTGWRSFRSAVHSWNAICATNRGASQVTFFSRGGSTKGGLFRMCG